MVKILLYGCLLRFTDRFAVHMYFALSKLKLISRFFLQENKVLIVISSVTCQGACPGCGLTLPVTKKQNGGAHSP